MTKRKPQLRGQIAQFTAKLLASHPSPWDGDMSWEEPNKQQVDNLNQLIKLAYQAGYTAGRRAVKLK